MCKVEANYSPLLVGSNEYKVMQIIEKIIDDENYMHQDTDDGFGFTVRQIQQLGKGQTWIKEGGCTAIRETLKSMKRKQWVDFIDRRWVINFEDFAAWVESDWAVTQ
jgi:hypothetical protein